MYAQLNNVTEAEGWKIWNRVLNPGANSEFFRIEWDKCKIGHSDYDFELQKLNLTIHDRRED
jgi:hypothetical protein